MIYKLSEEYSDEVKKIQNRLLYYNLLETSDIDGYFGIKTENAVKKYQEANGLIADGIVGDKTQEKLFSYDSKKDIEDDLYKPNEEESTYKKVNSYDTYFNEEYEDPLRKNNGTIDIKFNQNNDKNKRIKNVFFRSVGFAVDPRTGEAISEKFEFVAKDIDKLKEE